MVFAADILPLLERISRVLHNEGHSNGLKPTQWEALRYLARANIYSRNPTALTAYLGMTKGTVSQTLNALTRKKLVEKTTGVDRRQVRIDLTPAGLEILSRDPLHNFASSLSALSAPQKHELNEALRLFLHEALEARNGKPFGACKTCRYFQTDTKDGSATCGLLNVRLDVSEYGKICAEHESTAHAAPPQNGTPA